MDWIPIDRYTERLERELGGRHQAQTETRVRLYRGDLESRGRREGETAAGWIHPPRGWWRPSAGGMIGVTFVDYALCTAWQNTVRGACEVFVDVQVRETAAKLDVIAAIRKLHADGMRPGEGTLWEEYRRALDTLTERQYSLRHIRRLIPKALADGTSESDRVP
jgi:hypothetical protein